VSYPHDIHIHPNFPVSSFAEEEEETFGVRMRTAEEETVMTNPSMIPLS
jgi:hypothetical protein